MAIWNILWPFGIIYIWPFGKYSLRSFFPNLDQEKTGNPDFSYEFLSLLCCVRGPWKSMLPFDGTNLFLP
jgi:hypothetical protein